VKVLCTGDWHGDWATRGVERFADVERAAMRTCKEAIERRVDLYCFAGDLCDPDTGPVVFRCVELAIRIAHLLRLNGIDSVWIAGNHDVVEDGSGTTTLTPLRSIPPAHGTNGRSVVTYVAEEPRLLEFDRGGEAALLALPFTSAPRRYDPESVVANNGTGKKLLVLGHMTQIPGAKLGDETYELPRGRGVPFPVEALRGKAALMMNGHFHRRQTTPDGIEIPGSLARLTFGEESNEPGFIVAEV
jgi:DNA repair exonuclease SbcCD nuclease subunit